MDIKDFLKNNKKNEFKFGGRNNTNKIVSAVNLYDNIMKLEDDVEYKFKKNKFAICIYKEDKK